MTQGRNSKPATVLACALIALSLGTLAAPALAGAQAANDEYRLHVPGANADSTVSGDSPTNASSGGGAPVALIGLTAVAAACAGLAAWRLRGPGKDSRSEVRPGAPTQTSE